MIMINIIFMIMAIGVILCGGYCLATRQLPTYEKIVIMACMVINSGFIVVMWGIIK